MIPSKPKILIAGSGAVGSVFGGLLREAGHEVTLLGREWHLRGIESSGLEISGIWGDHRAEGFRLATRVGDLSKPYDLILVSVKAYDTELMVQEVAPYLSPGGIAIALQNGLGNLETLVEVIGLGRSLGASVLIGAKIPGPGKVTVTVYAAPVVIGPIDSTSTSSMELTRFWASVFSHVGIPCEPTDQILSHLWAKVLYNAPLNPLGAILRVHYGALGEEQGLKTIMDHIIDEVFRVGRKRGVRLLWKSADIYRELFYSKLLPATYDHQSSMLQDLERGRRTEIDALNGKIWRYGAELGIPTPFNEAVTQLIRGRESYPIPRRGG
ncbi:MAG: ketopantoate reductase family protein [Candidatus Binatia bacterium]